MEEPSEMKRINLISLYTKRDNSKKIEIIKIEAGRIDKINVPIFSKNIN